jgi:hypothetical protein
MLYKNMEDCNQCPLLNEFCKGGMTCSPGGMPIEPPCTCWNDDDDLDKIYSDMCDSQRRYEEAEDRRWKREEEARKKKEEKAKKARQTRWAVRTEQREIVSLRRKIRSNERLLSLAQGMAMATNFANEMFGYEERLVIAKKNPIESENEKLQTRINELIEIKKEKLKQHRNSQKEVANGQS